MAQNVVVPVVDSSLDNNYCVQYSGNQFMVSNIQGYSDFAFETNYKSFMEKTWKEDDFVYDICFDRPLKCIGY